MDRDEMNNTKTQNSRFQKKKEKFDRSKINTRDGEKRRKGHIKAERRNDGTVLIREEGSLFFIHSLPHELLPCFY